MIIAGLIILILSNSYLFYIITRLKKNRVTSESGTDGKLPGMVIVDFVGNVLMIGFFDFLGIMFIVNNINA